MTTKYRRVKFKFKEGFTIEVVFELEGDNDDGYYLTGYYSYSNLGDNFRQYDFSIIQRLEKRIDNYLINQ